ncbi:MAG: hypothetical protein HOW73_30655 [Polyangiaceae bacterium]|nr:hypothetical protein [Polyangiaceae bacterium]
MKNYLDIGRAALRDRAALWARRRELWDARPRLSPAVVGAFGVVCIYFTLGVLHAHVMRRYQSGDEPRHVAYAVQLADGASPKVTDPLPSRKIHYNKPGNMAAATHPPLYYWYVGPVLDDVPTGQAMDAAVRKARVMTVALGALALVYIFRIGRLLFPKKPAVALAMMTLVGTLPIYINTSALVFNDAMAALTMCAAFHGALRLMVDGPTRWRIGVATFWMALAAFTRISGFFVVAPGLLLAFVAFIWHYRGSWARRIALSTALCTGMGLVVLLVSGWFYLRNYRLYGDVTGASAFLPLFKRKPNAPTWVLITSIAPWKTFFAHLWVRLAGGVQMFGTVDAAAAVLSIPCLAGFVKALVHVRRNASELLRDRRMPAFVVGAMTFALMMIAMFMYHSRGGSLNARYALGVLWVPAVILAIGLASMRSPGLMQWILASIVLLTVLTTELYARTVVRKVGGDFAIVAGLRKAHVKEASSAAIVALGAIGLGLALLLRAVGQVYRRIDDELHAPAPAPAPLSVEGSEPADVALPHSERGPAPAPTV